MHSCRTALVLLGLGLPAKASAQGTSPPSGDRVPDSYVLRGTVRDAETGTPVSGVRIWPLLKNWGALSDQEGHYELRWRGFATESFLIRLCEDQNLATITVGFFDDSIVTRDIRIAASKERPCTSSDRLPWAVDVRDTTRFTGHYIYSWEGDGWLEACNGARYSPDWDSALGQRLRQWQQRDGQVSYVRFQGRVAPDHLSDRDSGTVIIGYQGPLFLAGKV